MTTEYYELLVQALTMWGVAAIFLERSLYHIFDTKLWVKVHDYVEEKTSVDLKPLIGFLSSWYLCNLFQFDLYAKAFGKPGSWVTILFTGLAIAGGATGFFKALARLRQIKDAAALKKINGNG